MNLLEQFVNFLANQKNKPSFLTVKNYKADVGQFINWFEKKFSFTFSPSKVTLQTLGQYKESRNLSPSSNKRHLSSLRKFFSFLKETEVINFDLFALEKTVSAEARALEDPYRLRNFKSFLYDYKKSDLTIKNYINDLKNFFLWLEQVSLLKYAWKETDKNLLAKINSSVIAEYKQRLITSEFSPLTINRKLSSLRNYISWAKKQEIIPENSEYSENQIVSISENQKVRRSENLKLRNSDSPSVPKYSPFPPIRLVQKSLRVVNLLFDNFFILPLAETIEDIQYLFWKVSGKKIFKNVASSKQSQINNAIGNIKKEFYAPLDISAHYLPMRKRIWHYLRHVRPNWYIRYHSYSVAHYFHFAILVILSSIIGFGVYNSFWGKTQKENAVLGAFTDGSRILSFQGKISDSQNNPIIKPADVLFSIYGSENSPKEAFLWQEKDLVKPASDGTFSVSLGENKPIPDTLFGQNYKLFLGIKVGDTPELLPRQQLATIPLAGNAQALQGLEPITNSGKTSNTVLALDSSGNLSISDNKPHTFQTIGGNLILSGSVLSLTTTPGSNGNVEIVPDGEGVIDLAKPIQNSTNNNNLLEVPGAVEFDDMVAILATSSAYSAFTINQNSTGSLISASRSGIAKFTVDNDGSGTFAGDLAINGGDFTSSVSTFNFLAAGVTTLNIGSGASSAYVKGNLTVDKDFNLPSLTSNGGILYTNGSGKILQASAGSSSDCLTGGSTPSFTSCSKIFGATAPLFKLDVWDSQSATAAAQIFNTATGTDADGLIVKLGNTNSTVDNANHFISFETSGIGIVGSIRGNEAGVQYRTDGIADFAEYLKKDQNQSIEYGSVICLDGNGLAVKCSHDNNKVIGVASERPAFLGGENLGNGSVAVGLIGQIETFAANLNGEIKAGDMLTASDIPGVAVKTTKAGQIVGKALENSENIDESRIAGFYDPDSKEYRNKANFPDISLKPNIIRVVKIRVLVNASWYDPNAYLANTGGLEIVSGSKYQAASMENKVSNDSPILDTYYLIRDTSNELIKSVGAFAEIAAANLKAGIIKAEEIVTQSLIVTSDSIIVNGQNLKDYIASVIKDSGSAQSKVISPIVNTTRLSADIISPLSDDSNISVSLHDSQFVIHDSKSASSSAIASIDNQGNATFSGQLQASQLLTSQLTTSDASISGTLTAKSIIADSIEGLEDKVSSYLDLASYSAQLSYVPDLAAERAQFNQGLMVFGATSLMDVSVAGQLSIGGTMFAMDNSIEVLGADLSLQSLRQGGLAIMGGLIYIDIDGNLKAKGDVSISGKLAVSGDMTASGSATFTKLNFSLIQPVLAVSATEVIASSSAGVANIASYQSEVTIKNTLVTDESVIYITPVGTPSAQAPFLMRQVPDGTWLRQQSSDSDSSQIGSFTVGVESPTNHPIDFNWLIVN